MATSADMAATSDGLGDSRANGAGKVRSRNLGTAVEQPEGSIGIVALVEAGDNGRVAVADSTPSAQKWKTTDSVYVRLAKAQDEVKTITQDMTIKGISKKSGKEFSFKGVSSAQVVTFAKRTLLDHGLVFLPRQTRDGVVVSGNMTSVYVNAAFACVDSEGLFETGAWGSGTDDNDKAHSKAYTNAVKNILSKTLMMSTLEDDDGEATPHEPDHKPRQVRNAEAVTDVAIKTWADAYKSAIDGCKTLAQLKKVRAENSHMMTNPGIPQVTKDYFLDKLAALEGTLE